MYGFDLKEIEEAVRPFGVFIESLGVVGAIAFFYFLAMALFTIDEWFGLDTEEQMGAEKLWRREKGMDL